MRESVIVEDLAPSSGKVAKADMYDYILKHATTAPYCGESYTWQLEFLTSSVPVKHMRICVSVPRNVVRRPSRRGLPVRLSR